jgi:hypothetical protein
MTQPKGHFVKCNMVCELSQCNKKIRVEKFQNLSHITQHLICYLPTNKGYHHSTILFIS